MERSVRSADAGTGGPTGWPPTFTMPTASPVPSVRTVKPGETQMFSVGRRGVTVLLAGPGP